MRKCLMREYDIRLKLLKRTLSAVILTAVLCILCLSEVQAEPAMEDVGENKTYKEGSVKVHVYKDGGLSSSGDIKISRSAAPGWDEILDSSTEWNLSGGSSDLRLTESKTSTIKKGTWPEGYIISKDYTGRNFETEDGRYGYLFMGVEVKIPAGWRYSGKRVHTAAENTANYIGIEESAEKAAEKARWVKGRYHLNITAAGLRTARKIRYTGTEYDILLEPNECRINFDANGGSGDMAALNVKYETSEKLPLCSYTRRGYTFKEWNTEKNGSGISFSDGQDVTKALPATTSIKLYAQWKEIKVSDVLVEPKKMVREEKTTEKLSVKVIPSNALNKRLSYVSSSPETAGVDATGKVQFKKPGNAVITVKSVNGKVATCRIGVYRKIKDLYVPDIKGYNRKNTNLLEFAYDKSNRERKVEKNEDLTIIGECGKYYYVRMDRDRTDGFIEKTKIEIPVVKVKIPQNNVRMKMNRQKRLKAILAPQIATPKALKWKTSNVKIATISSKGQLRSVMGGTARIIVTAENRKRYNFSRLNKKKDSLNVKVDYRIKEKSWIKHRNVPENKNLDTKMQGLTGIGNRIFFIRLNASNKSSKLYICKIINKKGKYKGLFDTMCG